MIGRTGQGLFQPGRRTSLPPGELQLLTNCLIVDPRLVWTLLGANPADPGSFDPVPEEIYRTIDILDDARELELTAAPGLGAYIRSAGGAALAVIGLGLGLATPIGSVIAGVSLAVGGISGLLTAWDAGRLIHQDLLVGERLRAIGQAQEALRAIIV